MTERTTVRLPEELLVRAKRQAAAQGCTLTALIEEGLRVVLAERQKSGPSRRVLPRVSAAAGGLVPGVDLASPSALQESDDLADMARMKHLE